MRKFLLCLLAMTLMPTAAVQAQGQSVEPRDYELMQSTYDECRARPQNTQYKCDCVAVKLMDSVRQKRERYTRMLLDTDTITESLRRDHSNLLNDSYRQCIDRDAVAVNSYGRCLDMSLKSRDDYRAFCGCYALRYADTIEQEGMNYFADPAMIMARAMIACNRELQR